MDFEFLGLCAIGGEVAFNNELKLKGFSLVEKFPGRIFFKVKDNFAKKQPIEKKRKLIRKEQIQKLKSSEISTESSSDSKENSNETTLFTAMLKANMYLQLADRIALLVTKFDCTNFDDLFEGIYACQWSSFFYPDSKITIEKVSTSNSKLSSKRAIQSVAQKAIYQKLCTKWHLTNLSETGDVFNVRLYLDNDIAYVTLDLSGEPLYKRMVSHEETLLRGIAPLRETTAAIMLQLMSWKRKTALHDPFCGSGTIPIEAVFYAHNIPSGILRNFTFQKFALFNDEYFKTLFNSIKAKSLSEIQTGNLIRITGSDIDKKAIELSIANSENACSLIESEMRKIGINTKLTRPSFIKADVLELKAPYDDGLLIGNPPYGERIGDKDEAIAVYEKIADMMRDFSGWKKAFITSLPEFKEVLTLKNPRLYVKEHHLKSGKLDTILYSF